MPVAAGVPSDGTSEKLPVVLEGIKAGDFKALLKVLYPRYELVFSRIFQ